MEYKIIDTYKDKQIINNNGIVCVKNPNDEIYQSFIIGLDDSKLCGKKVFCSEYNNVTTAWKYPIPNIPGHRSNTPIFFSLAFPLQHIFYFRQYRKPDFIKTPVMINNISRFPQNFYCAFVNRTTAGNPINMPPVHTPHDVF